jgi:fructokinase
MPDWGAVLVVGESLVDIVLGSDGEQLSVSPGGSPMNVTVGLARLGVPVRLITCLGADEYGGLIREHVAASGVELLARPLGGPTSTATARLDDQGRASYEFKLDWEPGSLPLTDDLACLHVGSLGTVVEPGDADVLSLVERAAETGLPISYDPNVRPGVSPDPVALWRRVRHLADRSTIVKMSDEDLAYLQPDRPVGDVLGDLVRGSRTEVAVVTRGAHGASGADRARSVELVSQPVDVVDTVGAGDAFMAGLLAAYWSGERDVLELMSAAMTVAAVTCGRRGADPPWREELGTAFHPHREPS